MPKLTSPIDNVKQNAVSKYKKELSEITDATGFEIAQALGMVGKSSEEQKKEMSRVLAERRQQVNFLLDGSKLNQAIKNVAMIENSMDILSDPEVLERVRGSVKTAYDYKQLADAQKTFIQNISSLNALDTLDVAGTSARLNLAVSLKNSDGTSTQVVVQAK